MGDDVETLPDKSNQVEACLRLVFEGSLHLLYQLGVHYGLEVNFVVVFILEVETFGLVEVYYLPNQVVFHFI